jgi:hypothetical protein
VGYTGRTNSNTLIMARIRTIKPEFWSHPLLGKQDDSTKLMAISLLNFADDEGYFHAEPNLVRGFCRPFDDNSTITRRCLDNLSKIGYISICENENYGPIGRIETFTQHQRIDRANESKLKDYYSTNARRTLDEQSTEEGKGKGKEGKRNRKGFIPPTLDQVKEYFKEKGYKESVAIKMFDSYSVADWHDSQGNKVNNWKQKAINIWFKDENKLKPQQQQQIPLAR